MKVSKPAVFYGWYILGSIFLILFFVQGTRSVFGVLFKPIINEFGWSRGAISLEAFINMTVFALSLTVVGRCYDRYGARKVLLVSTLCLAGGNIGVSMARNFWQFVLLDGFVTAIGFGGASVPLFSVLASKWFYRHRGLAVSIALAGGCLGQFALVPVATHLITVLSWRWAFFMIGSSILIVNLFTVWFVIRDDPREMGLVPLGAEDSHPVSTSGKILFSADPRRDITLQGAIHTRPFWLFLVVMFICGGGDFLALLHLVPMVTDHGISADIASKMLAWYGLLSLVGILITGRAIDKIGDKIPILVTFLFRAALFFYILKSQTLTAFYIFALGFGFTMMVTAPITATLMGRLYGLTHLGLISGVITTVHHFGGGVWGFLGGAIFDYTGNYRLVLALYGVCSVVAVGCTLFIQTRSLIKPLSGD